VRKPRAAHGRLETCPSCRKWIAGRFLRGHAVGHAVTRADAASFSVLKTFDRR